MISDLRKQGNSPLCGGIKQVYKGIVSFCAAQHQTRSGPGLPAKLDVADFIYQVQAPLFEQTDSEPEERDAHEAQAESTDHAVMRRRPGFSDGSELL